MCVCVCVCVCVCEDKGISFARDREGPLRWAGIIISMPHVYWLLVHNVVAAASFQNNPQSPGKDLEPG